MPFQVNLVGMFELLMADEQILSLYDLMLVLYHTIDILKHYGCDYKGLSIDIDNL